jgi:hypothetical protein
MRAKSSQISQRLILVMPLLAGLASGCALVQSPGLNTSTVDVGCVDDTRRCLDKRKADLEAIMADKSRRWIAQPATPATYASGIRMFAFMKLKKKLTCHELQIGLDEAGRARASLNSARNHLTNGQIARGALLGDEVATHMRKEMKRRRCRTKNT